MSEKKPEPDPQSRRQAREKTVQKIIKYSGLSGLGLGFFGTIGLLANGQFKAALISAIVTLTVTLIAIGGKFCKDVWEAVLNRVEAKLAGKVDIVADWIVERLEYLVIKYWWQLTSNFQFKYYQSLIYGCRDYRTQGLKTRGPFTLNLEKVFVPLRVAPESPDKISSEIIQTRESAEEIKIWDFLAASLTQSTYRSMVIIGAPGSGKTTLLEHLTLVYAQNCQRKYSREAPKLIPVLLYLRYVAKTIYSSQPTLAELVEQQESITKLNPRPNWFEDKLKHKQCLVMLDGLDEVADRNQRQAISSWLDKQIKDYSKAIFLLTSRPFGYQNASLEEIRTVLEVKPFNLKQMEEFIDSWYLHNKIAASLGKDDLGVRQKSQKQAKNLIERIKNNSSLASMALNPLLLTMIATIHAYRGALPGRRVELYAQICDVLLGSRQDAKGIPDALTADQNKIVLQVLALKLMERGIREFSPKQEEEQENSLIEIIQHQLAQVTSDEIKPQDFLEKVEKISGLLVEKEKGVYGFAHKSFQEYLAAVQIKENSQEQENVLTSNIDDSWWDETIRLYAAQSDGTNLISAALEKNTVGSLKLALDCAEEGLRIEPLVRQQLEDKLEAGLESSDEEIFKLAAEVKLAKRLSQFLRIDENREIDNIYITCAEYQLFLDESKKKRQERFPSGNAKEPKTANGWEAWQFCGWLSDKMNSQEGQKEKYYYRLPTSTEVQDYPAKEEQELKCWRMGENSVTGQAIRLMRTKSPALYRFEVITVDAQGEETQKEQCYAQYITENLTSKISLEMVYIPGGSFMMGSPVGEGNQYEKPQHEVTVQPFFMAKFQTTQVQWRAIASLPKVKVDLEPDPSHFKGDNLPVEKVYWHDAVEFCQRLSKQTGKEYRLPSEAEWEYACRAGTITPFHFGETITVELVNYRASETYSNEPKGEYREKTTPVGSFSPNAYGLYDMHGNVWEWCENDYHGGYEDAPTDGSAWLSKDKNTSKVLRGGSWDNSPVGCRSAFRYYFTREDRDFDIGFRVVCVAVRTT